MASNNATFHLFDAFYHWLGQVLAAEKHFLDHFAGCHTDEQRVASVHAVLDADQIQLEPRKGGHKDEKVAEKYLDGAVTVQHTLLGPDFDPETENEGTLENVCKALRLYGEAISYGPVGSSVVQRAHLGRAGLLSKLGQYADALIDCSRVKVSPSDVNLRCELAVVQSACLAKEDRKEAEALIKSALGALSKSDLEKEEKARLTVRLVSQMKELTKCENRQPRCRSITAEECPALFQGPHPSIPNASAAIDLQFTEEKGRYFVANTTIDAGSVVIVDEPYAWMLSPMAWHDHCTHCCKPVMAPIPCPTCTQVVFCSTDCMAEALSSYHGYECCFLHHFATSHELSSMALLVMRVVVRARDHLLDPLADPCFAPVHQQVSNSGARPVGDLVKRTATALFLAQGLRDGGLVADNRLVEAALLRHLQSCSCNAYEISEYVDSAVKTSASQVVAIGGAVYPTISLANHGCWANVCRSSHGRRCVVRATRRIEAGEELLDNYGYSFLGVSRGERRHALKKQYFFECGCLPCSEDWPLFPELKPESKFRCRKCGKLGLKSACKVCESKGAAKAAERKMRLINDRCQMALARVDSASFDDNVESWLIDFIHEMQTKVIHPNKELILAQQALVKIWGWKANRNRLLLLND
ncbi:SET and MYND domain-containing protein 4-like [Neocloeon triangulifer]|uniref:SET and MYND domain-containing protein 4-like n=1 Tax=Neocloeon triangulifer TaxID=2078957 RepID=UPI00286EDBF1|nr:SET and MYND domain-containing protein 4-like [Neocloeon triangulifer]